MYNFHGYNQQLPVSGPLIEPPQRFYDCTICNIHGLVFTNENIQNHFQSKAHIHMKMFYDNYLWPSNEEEDCQNSTYVYKFLDFKGTVMCELCKQIVLDGSALLKHQHQPEHLKILIEKRLQDKVPVIYACDVCEVALIGHNAYFQHNSTPDHLNRVSARASAQKYDGCIVYSGHENVSGKAVPAGLSTQWELVIPAKKDLPASSSASRQQPKDIKNSSKPTVSASSSSGGIAPRKSNETKNVSSSGLNLDDPFTKEILNNLLSNLKNLSRNIETTDLLIAGLLKSETDFSGTDTAANLRQILLRKIAQESKNRRQTRQIVELIVSKHVENLLEDPKKRADNSPAAENIEQKPAPSKSRNRRSRTKSKPRERSRSKSKTMQSSRRSRLRCRSRSRARKPADHRKDYKKKSIQVETDDKKTKDARSIMSHPPPKILNEGMAPKKIQMPADPVLSDHDSDVIIEDASSPGVTGLHEIITIDDNLEDQQEIEPASSSLRVIRRLDYEKPVEEKTNKLMTYFGTGIFAQMANKLNETDTSLLKSILRSDRDESVNEMKQIIAQPVNQTKNRRQTKNNRSQWWQKPSPLPADQPPRSPSTTVVLINTLPAEARGLSPYPQVLDEPTNRVETFAEFAKVNSFLDKEYLKKLHETEFSEKQASMIENETQSVSCKDPNVERASLVEKIELFFGKQIHDEFCALFQEFRTEYRSKCSGVNIWNESNVPVRDMYRDRLLKNIENKLTKIQTQALLVMFDMKLDLHIRQSLPVVPPNDMPPAPLPGEVVFQLKLPSGEIWPFEPPRWFYVMHYYVNQTYDRMSSVTAGVAVEPTDPDLCTEKD